MTHNDLNLLNSAFNNKLNIVLNFSEHRNVILCCKHSYDATFLRCIQTVQVSYPNNNPYLHIHFCSIYFPPFIVFFFYFLMKAAVTIDFKKSLV